MTTASGNLEGFFRSYRETLAFHDLAPIIGLRGVASSWRNLPGQPTRIAGVFLTPEGELRSFVAQIEEDACDVREAIKVASVCGQASWSAPGLLATARQQGVAVKDVTHLSTVALGACCGINLPRAGLWEHVKGEFDIAYDGAYLQGPNGMDEAVEALRAGLAQAWAAFDLPPALREAVEAIREHGFEPTRCLPRLAQDNERGRRLREFVRSHPLLAKAGFGSSEFWAAFDAEGDILHGLRRVLPGLSAAHLKRMAGLAPRDIPHHAYYDRDDAELMTLGLMKDLPVDWLPAPEGFPAFLSAAFVAMSAALVTRDDADPSAYALAAPQLLAASKGDWAGLEARLRELTAILAPGGGPYGPVDLYVEDLEDARLALAVQVAKPLLAHAALAAGAVPETGGAREFRHIHEASRPLATRLLFGGKSITGVLEACIAWHRQQEAINAKVGTATDADAWPALFEAVRFGDVEVRVVADGLALREEGAKGLDRHGAMGMDHCVATRRLVLLRGEAHVLSIRRILPDGGYERLSTAQVAAPPLGGFLHVTEHRGPRNEAPPAEATAALDRLLEIWLDPATRPRVDPAALVRRDLTNGDAGIIGSECQYDWRDEAQLANALEAWAPCLPRCLRGISPMEAVERLRERGLLEDFDARCGLGDHAPAGPKA